MEGGIVYGLSYALLGEITVKNGAVVQNNFDDYPVLRIHQTPKISAYVVTSPKVSQGRPEADEAAADRRRRAPDPRGRPRPGQRDRRRGRTSHPRDPVLLRHEQEGRGALRRDTGRL